MTDNTPKTVDAIIKEFEQLANLSETRGGWMIPYEGTYIGKEALNWLHASITSLLTEIERRVVGIEIDPLNEHTPYWQLGAARMKMTALTIIREVKGV